MTKMKYKCLISFVSILLFLGTMTPAFSMLAEAAESASESSDEAVNYSISDGTFYSEELKSQEAIEIIQEKYGEQRLEESNLNDFNEPEKTTEYTLTEEDERRMEQAISDYLKLVNYNPRLRGLGKNWWNSTGFVASVIDVGLIAIGLWSSAGSVNAVRTILRNNRTNITRMVERQILARIGIGVGGLLSAMFNIALTIASTSIGGCLAEGLDRADGRNDNYIWA